MKYLRIKMPDGIFVIERFGVVGTIEMHDNYALYPIDNAAQPGVPPTSEHAPTSDSSEDNQSP